MASMTRAVASQGVNPAKRWAIAGLEGGASIKRPAPFSMTPLLTAAARQKRPLLWLLRFQDLLSAALELSFVFAIN